MGTSYRVTVPEPLPATAAALAAIAVSELERVDALMSTYREDSELSRFNRHDSTDPFPVSPQTIEVLSVAMQVSEATSGAFDVTVGPLVDAWGFGPVEAAEPPSNEQVAQLRSRTGWSKLELNTGERTIRKAVPGLRCDLSAIAKGYAVDRVASALEGLGCRDYMVEVGGEVRAAGSNAAGDPWRIGIERPDPSGRTVQRILQLRDESVATSGDYRNFREDNGVRQSHILDPRSGRPVAIGVTSATVLDASATRADAFATALRVLGEAEALALAEREDLAVYLVVQDGEGGFGEASSSRFRARMKHGSQ